MVNEIKPCPFCGNTSPFTYITFRCAVIQCKCGATLDNCSAIVMYKKGNPPKELVGVPTYEANALQIKQKDGTLLNYPDHGYVGVDALDAFKAYGILDKWNNRV